MKSMIYAWPLGLLMLLGCSSDEYGYPDMAGVEAEIYATVNQSLTRASGTTWDTGDAIGVTLNSSANYQYMVSNTSTGAFAAAGDPIYITSQTSSTLTAYYPFSGTAGTSAGTLTVSTATANQTSANQPNIDYLYGTGTASQTNYTVNLSMEHRMSQIVFALQDIEDTDVTSLTFTLTNIDADGTFVTTTGTAAGDGALDDEVSTETVSATTEASLILLPQTATGVVFTVCYNSVYYQTTLTTLTLEAGYTYAYNITVDQSSASPTLTLSGITITDWTEGTSVEVTVEIDVPEVTSSVGDNPSWTSGTEKTTTATTAS